MFLWGSYFPSHACSNSLFCDLSRPTDRKTIPQKYLRRVVYSHNRLAQPRRTICIFAERGLGRPSADGRAKERDRGRQQGNLGTEKAVFHWFKRWSGRLKRTLSSPLRRLTGPQLCDVRFSYEKAGLRICDGPLPWNAEAVLAEARVAFPPSATWRKSDFQLRVPGYAPFMAVSIHPDDQDGVFRILFRLPPLRAKGTVSIYCQARLLGQEFMPFLSSEEFFRNLSLGATALSTSLGKHHISCQSYVDGQCQGIASGALITSPTRLLPLVDSQLTVEFRDVTTDCSQKVVVIFTPSELQAKQAFLTVVPPRWPRYFGMCGVRWILDGRPVGHAEIRGVSQTALQRSLYLIEARYVYEESQGNVVLSHFLPARDGLSRVRPCFHLASSEPGMAALCLLEIRVQFRDPKRPPLVYEREVLVTDGPSVCTLPAPEARDIQEVRAFELLSQGRMIGVLTVRPTPVAHFTDEGGFRQPEDYDWTPFSEEELVDRLQRLMPAGHEEKALDSGSPV
jgi:hypothetical protein